MGPVMIMAGGTGGHIFPALAVAEKLRAIGCEVFWLGSPQGLESRLVPEHGFALETLAIAGIRGTGLVRKLLAPIQITKAVIQARAIIQRRCPMVALGMGGFASGPGGLAAATLGIPLIIHEQNRIPGLTNRWLSKLATRVYQAFPNSFPVTSTSPVKGREQGGGVAITCGNPVRQEIVTLPPPEVRWANRTGPLRLLVLGGSQGARALNNTVPQALALLPTELRPDVRHQSGPTTLETTHAAYQTVGIAAEITAFIRDMAAAYGWADLVIARAGALTLSELAAAGVGALLVPFPHAVDDHQTRNAAWLVEAGAAHLLPQNTLTADSLATALRPYVENRANALVLAKASRSQAQVTAAAIMAQACIDLMAKNLRGPNTNVFS